jgi:hypothetical protein
MEPPASAADPRMAVFCSRERPEVFRSVAQRSDIWKPDPFDVESIHAEARTVFERLVNQAASPSDLASGRILLLKGEAGSGKTHLMRAFRNRLHGSGRGYFGYMQMTSATSDYSRYILNNLIDSLDQPYFEPHGPTTALMRLSTALAESPRSASFQQLDVLRSDEIDPPNVARLVNALADQVVMDARFNHIDTDLIRALLYLQRDDPRIRGPVLKYLRCEDLSAHDREWLGAIEPRRYDSASQVVIQKLGQLMLALESVPLVVCVDQLEDIFDLSEAAIRFKRAIAALCEVVSRLPSAVVVISCLEDYYDEVRKILTKSHIDRIEQDPKPVQLQGVRSAAEIAQLIECRLRYLFESWDAPFDPAERTYPFPADVLRPLAGLRTRDVLERCREYQEACRGGPLPPPPPPPPPIGLEQAWNDFRSESRGDVPADEGPLAELLAFAVRACADEFADGRRFEAEASQNRVVVERLDGAGATRGRRLIGICNKGAQGRGLRNQVEEVESRAREAAAVPVLARSSAFPSNPATQIAQILGRFVAAGGRKVVVSDSDWRTMLALRAFREEHQDNPGFAAWLTSSRPLGQLDSLRAMIDLDEPGPGSCPGPAPEPEPTPVPERSPLPAPAAPSDPPEDASTTLLRLGTTRDRAAAPVELDPQALRKHAAFLGGTGSGKTTLAMNVVEQLLLQGIPAVLVDRKGDLCNYGRPEFWTYPLDDPGLEARREALRRGVEIGIYTPGHPEGRPLSIAIAPPGLGRLGEFERGQAARFAAAALAGMMNYNRRGNELSKEGVLRTAIDQLARLEPDAPVTLTGLISYVAGEEDGLVNAVGHLDLKQFRALVQDLETLRLSRGDLLSARGEPLSAEALFGLGPHARPGRTRLSLISTKYLRNPADVQFWVSQLLVELGRWINRAPAPRLQAVLLCDEADLYLPAVRQPPTKEPMENLLRRGRSAGLGVLLATQSPGDFDYRCRDNIGAWFVGQVREANSLAKMRPMLADCRADVESRLPGQAPGQFHLLRAGAAVSLLADRPLLETVQLDESEILRLARASRPSAGT